MTGKMRQAEKILHTVRNKGQLYDLRSSLDDAEEEEPSRLGSVWTLQPGLVTSDLRACGSRRPYLDALEPACRGTWRGLTPPTPHAGATDASGEGAEAELCGHHFRDLLCKHCRSTHEQGSGIPSACKTKGLHEPPALGPPLPGRPRHFTAPKAPIGKGGNPCFLPAGKPCSSPKKKTTKNPPVHPWKRET